MLTVPARFFRGALVLGGLATLGACGGDDGNAAPDASVTVDAPLVEDAPDGCQAGYQDEDGDGTCKLGCEGTGANDALNCGAGGTCEIDGAGDRGCICDDGYERSGEECVLDLPPTTNLALWLDADHAASLQVSSNRVASWTDRRGGNAPIALSQATASARPGYNATGHAGRGSVIFDGDDQLFVNSFSALSGADYEVIVALNPLGTGAKGIVSLASGTTNWGMLLEQPANGGDYTATHRSPAGTTGGAAATADRTNAPGSGWVSATYQSSEALDTLAVFASDGAMTVTNVAAAANGPIGSPLTFRVGRSQNGFMAGEILEVLVYETRLTVAQRKEVTDYMKAKWNLP